MAATELVSGSYSRRWYFIDGQYLLELLSTLIGGKKDYFFFFFFTMLKIHWRLNQYSEALGNFFFFFFIVESSGYKHIPQCSLIPGSYLLCLLRGKDELGNKLNSGTLAGFFSSDGRKARHKSSFPKATAGCSQATEDQ